MAHGASQAVGPDLVGMEEPISFLHQLVEFRLPDPLLAPTVLFATVHQLGVVLTAHGDG